MRKILEIANLRTRFIVLLEATTAMAMRIGPIPNLNIRNLTKIHEELYAITVYEAEKEQYTIFCTPDCAKTIDEYLQYRLNCI